ncbi:MAG: biotin transporter BioY [Planctomycetota bacterium]|jgi:biotin transport system substrate-specific component|nr:biotin transporter BioY [Planctomycetota bacterium]
MDGTTAPAEDGTAASEQVSLDALRQLARASMFAALIGAGAFIVVPAGPLFFSLQTMAVSLAGFALGVRQGLTAILIYLAAGFFGLPMFGMGKAGPVAFMGPTCGFFLGFVFQTAIAGLAHGVRGRSRRIALMAALGTAGFLVMLAFGAAGLRITVIPTWKGAFLAGMAAFLPVEPIKLLLAIVVAEGYLRRNPEGGRGDA